jgi:phage FluMu gp28-like protein
MTKKLISPPPEAYFLPYQLKWILDDDPKKLFEKSRRVGITYATSYRCIAKLLRKPSGYTQWVSSRDQGLAQEFVAVYCRKWCQLLNIAATGLTGKQIDVVDQSHTITAYKVILPNGTRIMSISSSPSAFAGKGGDILLDEVDLHDDSGTLIDMATPCVMWGGQLEIVSAYDAKGSADTPFARLVKEAKGDNPMHWSLHCTTLTDAVHQGLAKKINQVTKQNQTDAQFIDNIKQGCRTRQAWLSQYCCIPRDATATHAISLTDIAAAQATYDICRVHITGDATQGDAIDPAVSTLIYLAPWSTYMTDTTRYTIGVDIARTGHLASIWIDERLTSTTAKLIALITLHKTKFSSLQKLISHILDTYPLATAAGDATGLGMETCERLNDIYDQRFLPVNFGAKKQELGTMLIAQYERQHQIIPTHPAEIAADIKGIQTATATKTGKLLFAESPNPLNPLSHCDMAWSEALALYADKYGRSAGHVACQIIGLPSPHADNRRSHHPLAPYQTTGGCPC